MQKNNLIIYCDGGSRGNPGPAASAFVVTNDSEVIYKESKFLGVETNNVAEYTAVLLATEWLAKQSTANSEQSTVIINLDSQLVERQLNGKYRIRNMKLKNLHDKIKMKIKESDLKINFLWNFREKNTLADDLVNETLDRALQRENEK